MNALLDSICKAGLNRARIHDALANIVDYEGVTGHMVFDPNQKNVAPMYLGTVHDGDITYRTATMSTAASRPSTDATHAQTINGGAASEGSLRDHVQSGPARVILFGPHAAEVAQTPEMQAQLSAPINGANWELLPVSSDQSWGAASTQLVHALMEDHAVAIVALDRDSSHLAEQLALKTFVPVIALSGDKTLTSANIPWIFRLPADTNPVAGLRLLESASSRGGIAPAKLRDALASGNEIGGMAFLPSGEPLVR